MIKKQNKPITILGSFPPIRGISAYCLEFAKAIAQYLPVEFISFKSIYPSFLYPGGGLKNDHSFPDIDSKNFKVFRKLTWYNPLAWLYEGISHKGRLLHAQWWSLPLALIYAVIALCFKLRGRPVVFTVHNVLPHEKSFLYYFVTSFLFKLCDHFIVHTQVNKEQLISVYNKKAKQVSVIPHGPLECFKNICKTDKLRKKMGINSHEKIILLFGAIRSYKGISTALKAFAKIINSGLNYRLVIAGKLWEDWKKYENLMSKLGISDYVITWLDYIPTNEVACFFSIADLVILPYHHFDSQSGVGCLALGFSKPIIVTDVGGLSDLVVDKQWVVPAGDISALADAVEKCLRDPDILKQMQIDAEIVYDKISWHSISKKTLKVYEKLLQM